MLHQRSYSIEKHTVIDFSVFSHEEKQKCMKMMDLEEAKIKNYLSLQAIKKAQLKERLSEMQQIIELVILDGTKQQTFGP